MAAEAWTLSKCKSDLSLLAFSKFSMENQPISFLYLLILSIAMGMDVFSVSMAVASGPRSPRQTFRLSFHFGLFQFMMPVIGWAIGYSIMAIVQSVDHWIAFGMLGAIGGHMIWEGCKHEEERSTRDRSKGWSLVTLSIATSIDALGVGLTFGVLNHSIVYPALIIGITSSVMSFVAIKLGRKLRSQFGHRMEIIGGIVLIVIAIKMLSI